MLLVVLRGLPTEGAFRWSHWPSAARSLWLRFEGPHAPAPASCGWKHSATSGGLAECGVDVPALAAAIEVAATAAANVFANNAPETVEALSARGVNL